jgi:hypothetical protein
MLEPYMTSQRVGSGVALRAVPVVARIARHTSLLALGSYGVLFIQLALDDLGA